MTPPANTTVRQIRGSWERSSCREPPGAIRGYREFEAEWRGAWDAYWIVPQELIDLGDRYLIIVQMAGHARGSTLTVTQPAAILEELDDRGMIIREQRFTDPAQALDMLGGGGK